MAIEVFGSIIANMQNIINYIRRNKARLFLVNEQETITGDLQITNYGVSYAADSVLLIRFAEIVVRIIKVIDCLKKRIGNFQSELREFKISPKGIEVGQKLERFHRLLTGTPTIDMSTSHKKNGKDDSNED